MYIQIYLKIYYCTDNPNCIFYFLPKKFLFDLYFLALYNKLIVIKVESGKLSHKKDAKKKEVRIYGKCYERLCRK